jgi:predicted HTH domain antitoxin
MKLHRRRCVSRVEKELTMVQMTLEMPEGVLADLHKDPKDFVLELRLAAAVKWYEMQTLSQGRAAEVAGVSRAEFIEALGRFGISPFQYDAEDILAEARRG